MKYDKDIIREFKQFNLLDFLKAITNNKELKKAIKEIEKEK